MESGSPKEPSSEADETIQMSPEERREQRRLMTGIVIGLLVVVALVGLSIWGLLLPTTDTGRIRDIFIIFMALESLFLGLAVVILIIQVARLINLLQNEIKPILESTNETVSTLRGTTAFLSDNMVQPVIKANEMFAGLRQALVVLGLARSGSKKHQQGE